MAGVRHVEPDLSRNDFVDRLKDNPSAYAEVRKIVEEKMAVAELEQELVDRCLTRLDELRDAWIAIADRQTENGDRFVYAKAEPVQRLLQDTLGLRGNNFFVAARSMRDTEPVALLKIRRPDGRVFE